MFISEKREKDFFHLLIILLKLKAAAVLLFRFFRIDQIILGLWFLVKVNCEPPTALKMVCETMAAEICTKNQLLPDAKLPENSTQNIAIGLNGSGYVTQIAQGIAGFFRQ